jgi:hypothetical protein
VKLEVLCLIIYNFGSRGSSVVVEAAWTGRGSNPGSGKIFSAPQRPDRLWGPPNPLSNSTGRNFPGGEAARACS